MKTRIVISWNAKLDNPLQNIIVDQYPAFDVILFDYTGTRSDQVVSSVALSKGNLVLQCSLVSVETECKGDIFSTCAKLFADDFNEYDYIGFFDDDILIRTSCIHNAINQGASRGLSGFQPSLAKCSYYAHPFTAQQLSCGVRMVDWIEVMMPIIDFKLFLASAAFYGSSISSYGIDCYVWPVVALADNIGTGFAVIDSSIASHIRPISSGGKKFRTGFTGLQELARIRQMTFEYLQQSHPHMLGHPKVKSLLSFAIG